VLGSDAVWLAVAGGVALVGVALGVAAPGALTRLWDAYTSAGPLTGPALQVAAVFVGRFLLQWLSSSLLVSASESGAGKVREHLLAHLLEQDMAYFDGHDTAGLVALLTDDVKELRDAVRAVVGEGLVGVAHCVGTVVSLAATSPPLTAALAAALPIMLAIGNGYGARLRDLSRRNQELQGVTAAVASESLGHIRTVRAFTGEAEEVRKFGAAHAASSAASARLGNEITAFRGLVTGGLTALGGVVLALGGRLVAAGSLTTSALAAFLAQTFSLERSLEELSVVGSRLLRASGTASRVTAALAETPVVNVTGGVRWPRLVGDLRLDGVSFAYPTRPAATVLRDVSLALPAGRVTAICGPSGGGKSTIAALLLGFYAPTAGGSGGGGGGRVLVDGRPLNTVDLAWYRGQVAYVPQDAAMFNGTIRDNILYGNHGANAGEVEAAARAAHAWDFIQGLPAGLDTRVGERGVALSGGQRQRVALARALLRNPRILILDEYSSALDAEAEAVVQTALAEKFQDRTVLIIAHRLSTIAAADRIYVVGKGTVLEAGDHDSLLAAGGVYAKLVQRQRDSGKAPEAVNVEAAWPTATANCDAP